MELGVESFQILYANNIAFNAASNNAYYKKMMKALLPGYSGSNATDLSSKLLDEAS